MQIDQRTFLLLGAIQEAEELQISTVDAWRLLEADFWATGDPAIIRSAFRAGQSRASEDPELVGALRRQIADQEALGD